MMYIFLIISLVICFSNMVFCSFKYEQETSAEVNTVDTLLLSTLKEEGILLNKCYDYLSYLKNSTLSKNDLESVLIKVGYHYFFIDDYKSSSICFYNYIQSRCKNDEEIAPEVSDFLQPYTLDLQSIKSAKDIEDAFEEKKHAK